MKNILTDYIACFEDYIQESRQLCIVVLDEALRIRTTNQCFRDIMGTMAPLEGEDFKALLLPESRHILPLDNASASLTIPLNLNTKNAGVLSLECRIYKQEAPNPGWSYPSHQPTDSAKNQHDERGNGQSDPEAGHEKQSA